MSKLVRFMVVAALVLVASSAGAQSAPDALVVDPDVHQVMLDNEHVRVFRALAAHGAKSPMHSHPPLVIVSLGTGRVRLTLPDGKKQVLDLYPGFALWIPGTEHSWELLAGEINIVAVEVKAAKAAIAAAAKPK
jgi:quercetin dioxygenase-like cupin family protein